MVKLDLIKQIFNLDINIDDGSYHELIDNINLLEDSYFKLYNILIETRLRKLMIEFGEKETDIYVVSYPKSGTTLMQMILYQMNSDGNMNFDHIYDVSPWLRDSARNNTPVRSAGDRRIIKTHDDYELLKDLKKAKYIVIIRDCLDVMYSFFIHTINYEGPVLDFKKFCQLEMPEWFKFNTEWLQNYNKLTILYINYEDLILNKEMEINRISRFIGIDINKTLMARIIRRTSFQFMKKNEKKFGEQPNTKKIYNRFIRKGLVGEGINKFTDKELAEYRNLATEFLKTNIYTQRYFT